MTRPETVFTSVNRFLNSLDLSPRSKVRAALARAVARKLDLLNTNQTVTTAEIVNRLATTLEQLLADIPVEG